MKCPKEVRALREFCRGASEGERMRGPLSCSLCRRFKEGNDLTIPACLPLQASGNDYEFDFFLSSFFYDFFLVVNI